MSKFMNYVPQPLAFYQELAAGDRRYQNYNLNQCKGDLSTWKLIIVASISAPDSPGIHIPAFQIKTTPEPSAVSDFHLWAVDGSYDEALNPAFFTVEDLGGGYFAHVFDGTNILPISGVGGVIPATQYYLTVSDGVNVWYSEVFEFADEDSENTNFPAACGEAGWALLRWSNPNCIISQTIHNTGTFHLFLPVDLGQPKYDYKPDTQDDGDGGQDTTFQRLDKRWEFYIKAPEYIADALEATQMFSDVQIAFVGNDFMQCRDIEVDVDWQDSCFAKITFKFSADFLAKTACCG